MIMKKFGKAIKKGVRFYMEGMNRTSAMYVNTGNVRAPKF